MHPFLNTILYFWSKIIKSIHEFQNISTHREQYLRIGRAFAEYLGLNVPRFTLRRAMTLCRGLGVGRVKAYYYSGRRRLATMTYDIIL